MRVYCVRKDCNRFQQFSIDESEKCWDPLDHGRFDCRPKADTWKAPAVYVLHPKLGQGNFFGFGSTLAVDTDTANKLHDFLVRSGELLPLTHEGKHYFVVNTIECINALDQEKTQWATYANGTRGRILQHAFHKRFTTSLFKIPETCRTDILTFEDSEDPDEEFKARVEHLGLTGLRFEELWNDEDAT